MSYKIVHKRGETTIDLSKIKFMKTNTNQFSYDLEIYIESVGLFGCCYADENGWVLKRFTFASKEEVYNAWNDIKLLMK